MPTTNRGEGGDQGINLGNVVKLPTLVLLYDYRAWGTGWRRKSWLPLLVFVICICLDLVYLSEKNALSKSLGVYGRGSLETLVDWSSMCCRQCPS